MLRNSILIEDTQYSLQKAKGPRVPITNARPEGKKIRRDSVRRMIRGRRLSTGFADGLNPRHHASHAQYEKQHGPAEIISLILARDRVFHNHHCTEDRQ